MQWLRHRHPLTFYAFFEKFHCVAARAKMYLGGLLLGWAWHQSACKIRDMHIEVTYYLFLLRKAARTFYTYFFTSSPFVVATFPERYQRQQLKKREK